jgi:type IV secretion system protein VirB2
VCLSIHPDQRAVAMRQARLWQSLRDARAAPISKWSFIRRPPHFQGDLTRRHVMTKHLFGNENVHSQCIRLYLFVCAAMFLAMVLPDLAFAQDASGTIDTTCKFATNINKILNALSIVVVTIAVIFSGYQIAFAHKRIGDVAPVLIGAVLIGAAGQIAKMFLADSTTTAGATECTAAVITQMLNFYA